MFDKQYKLDLPTVTDSNHPVLSNVQMGTYNSGLITFSDQYTLESWKWLLPNKVQFIAHTAFGDFFFMDLETNGFHFCDVQNGTTSQQITNNKSTFLDKFLTKQNIMEKVLKLQKFEDVQNRISKPFDFGQCYIADPWLMLGGSDHAETYEIGGFHEYLTLVSKTLTDIPAYVLLEDIKDANILGCWSKHLGAFDEIIGYSVLGAIFLRSSSTHNYLLLYPLRVSGNNSKNYGSFKSITEFENKILKEKSFLKYCLAPIVPGQIPELQKRLGVLNAEQVYFPVPHPSIGGSWDISTFKKGNVWINADIAGQNKGIK